jgi:hypothetical protein
VKRSSSWHNSNNREVILAISSYYLTSKQLDHPNTALPSKRKIKVENLTNKISIIDQIKRKTNIEILDVLVGT